MDLLTTNRDDKHREIEKIDNYWHKIGYHTTSLATGLVAGLILGTGRLIIGAVAALKNSANAIIKKQSDKALENATSDKLSIKDLEKLSRREKLGDANYRQIAIFVDRLEAVSGSLVEGRQVGEDYIFTKSVDRSGKISYLVTDAKSQQELVKFDLHQSGEVSIKKVAKSPDKLMIFIKSTAQKISLNLELPDRHIIAERDLSSALFNLERSANELQQSLETLKTPESTDEKLKYIDNLSAATDKLLELQAQSEKIRTSIDLAVNANLKESERNPLQADGAEIKVSLLADKLAEVNHIISRIEANIREQQQPLVAPQILEEVKPRSGSELSMAELTNAPAQVSPDYEPYLDSQSYELSEIEDSEGFAYQ